MEEQTDVWNKNNKKFDKPKKLTIGQKLHGTASMLALTIIALTTAIYAWFTLSASTRVRDLELDVTAGANLKIDTVSHGSSIDQYKSELFDTDIDDWLKTADYEVKTLEDILLAPQTSGNGADFYTRQANEGSGDASKPNIRAGSYMEYELWFIAENDMRVHLSTDDDDNKIWTHITPSDGNDSGQERIVDCVRMSFDCEEDNRMVIWKCGGDVSLKGKAKNDISGGSLRGYDIVELDLPDHNAMRYSDDTWICDLRANTPKKVTVRVWVEGEDPQCSDEVQRAKFITELRFQGTDSRNNVIS